MKMEETECSETSVYKIQTPGNHPEESIQQYVMISKTALFMVYLTTLPEIQVT